MGYGYYTVDFGRPAGYMVLATCDKRGCDAEIDRGLAYLCGHEPGMFSGDGGCGRYYCDDHLGGIGPRGGCRHPRGFRYWGKTLACMAETGTGPDSIVCLDRLGHETPHAWADEAAGR